VPVFIGSLKSLNENILEKHDLSWDPEEDAQVIRVSNNPHEEYCSFCGLNPGIWFSGQDSSCHVSDTGYFFITELQHTDLKSTYEDALSAFADFLADNMDNPDPDGE
jgi:hypothetical protein